MTDVVMPQMGESIVEGTLTKWLKKPGDKVNKYDLLVEVQTDKAAMEVESAVEGTLRAIVAADPGDLLVIDHQGRMEVNSFGGVAAFTAQRRGVVGAVIDGVSRDLDEMREMNFPVFGKGFIQQSVRGHCACGGFGEEIRIGGFAVRRGDYVAADENGIVVIPAGRVEEVLAGARHFYDMEELIKREIGGGTDPVEAHRKAGYEVIKGRG